MGRIYYAKSCVAQNSCSKVSMLKCYWNRLLKNLGTHQFDLFCTSTHQLYFDLNLTSSFLAKLYFDPCFSANKRLMRTQKFSIEYLKISEINQSRTLLLKKFLTLKYLPEGICWINWRRKGRFVFDKRERNFRIWYGPLTQGIFCIINLAQIWPLISVNL